MTCRDDSKEYMLTLMKELDEAFEKAKEYADLEKFNYIDNWVELKAYERGWISSNCY